MGSYGRFSFYPLLALAGGISACAGGEAADDIRSAQSALAVSTTNPNSLGRSATLSLNGPIDTANPFFQSLGTNGRACVTCHAIDDGFTITPAKVQSRFDLSSGTDPLFRLNDGANSPKADVSSANGRSAAYSMLRTRGLIRVGLPIPPTGEFTLLRVNDPYSFASAQELSLFRRPLPVSNIAYLSTVMWDGRESVPGQTLDNNLKTQANDATLGHAQAALALDDNQRSAIIAFQKSLFVTQFFDFTAGQLDESGGQGGPTYLSSQSFFIGINDPLGLNPQGSTFNPAAMTLFNSWHMTNPRGARDPFRAQIARGEDIFNSKRIVIQGVKGLNDETGIAQIQGTCTTCHDSPNIGHHSVSAPLDIGLTDASRRTSDMPLYTLRNKTTGATVDTTDPGRAMITGKWKDIGRFKGPILRALATRAPYFHNGSAATLSDVINFYDSRFGVGLSTSEKQDLLAFLQVL